MAAPQPASISVRVRREIAIDRLVLAELAEPGKPITPRVGPLGRFLRHPGRESDRIIHHVLHDLAAFGRLVLPIAVAMVLALVLLQAALWVIRARRSLGDAHFVAIAPGPEVDSAGAKALWNALHGILRRTWRGAMLGRPHVSFELARSTGRLRIGIWVPPGVSPARVARAAQAAWPGAGTDILPASPPLPDGASVVASELRLADREWFPLRSDHETDSYRMLLGTIDGLGPNDHAAIQVLARPAAPRRYRRARRAAAALRTGLPISAVGRFLDLWTTKGVHPAPSHDPFRSADVRSISEKSSALCFDAVVRYGVAARDADRFGRRRLRSDAQGIVAAFALYDGRNRLTRRRLPRAGSALSRRWLGRGDLLSVSEVAALAHLPTDRATPGLSRAGAHAMAPPPEVGWSGKMLGRAQTGDRRPVALAVADARQHLHILGATGSGKSTLITNLVLQDVAGGRGAVVCDPKGDLVSDILERLPENIFGRVVVLDPSDDEAPPAMNVLEASDPHLAVDHLVVIFHRLFEAYWGPRTDDVLRVAALTALRREGATLADVPRLLTDPVFRAACTRGLDDPAIESFWEGYERISPAAQAQMVGPVMNKLRVVLTRPFVAAVLGSAESSFDLARDVLDRGLLLARLPKGILGEDCSRLLGSFVVARVWQTVTARARAGEHARVDAALYLDECQNFLTLPGSIADMLAEARGYRLSVVAAHQHLSQLPRELREALSANARNKVFFNCSSEDARILERDVAPELTAHDLSHLGAHQAAARLVVDWEEAPAFTLCTEPAPPPILRRAAEVRGDARRHFGRSTIDRHDEALRHALAGRRGAKRRGEGEGTPVGRSLGRSAGTSLGHPHVPRRLGPEPHDTGSITPASGDPDSWGDP